MDVDVEKLGEAIIDGLNTYTEQVSNEISKAVKECTNKAHEDITELSPVRKRVPKSGVIMVKRGGIKVPAKENLQPGAYKKGWVTVVRNYENRTQGYVRNKTNYQIAHLLELGHKARNGRPVAAIEHIRKGQDDARAELDKRIKEILEKE